MAQTEDHAVGLDQYESLPRRILTVWLPLFVFVFVLLFPFYWMGITAFKPNEELLSREGNPFWVSSPTLAHFKKLLFDTEEMHFGMPNVYFGISLGMPVPMIMAPP